MSMTLKTVYILGYYLVQNRRPTVYFRGAGTVRDAESERRDGKGMACNGATYSWLLQRQRSSLTATSAGGK